MGVQRYNHPMDNVRTVFTTDGTPPPRCPTCGEPAHAGGCAGRRPRAAPSRAPALPDDGVVRVWRDRKRRRGKTVTVLAGVPGGPAALEELAATLKRHCGSGGTVQADGTIEIQGDHRDRIAQRLAALGHRVKLAGG